MKTARDVGDVDVRHDAGIVAAPVEAEAFAHVAIDRHAHAALPLPIQDR
jgi:hypothetical protein